MFHPRFAASMILLSLAIGARPLLAQDDAMIEIYGQGLHRYYAGDYVEAERLLSMVVDSGTQDPRAFYFRGLSQFMQGRTHEAKYDFEAGAQAEARGKRVVNVGYALQRVQGPKRLEIEKARQAARMAVLVEQAMARRVREDAAKAAGAAAPPATAATPAPSAASAAASESSDPFGGKGTLQAGQATPDAAKPAASADQATNPFQDDPSPTAPATPAADPFAPAPDAAPAEAPAAGAAPADPFATPPAEATPAADPGNPFGG